ncbi:Protein FAR1-RELATED SEQUENCE 3 [Acorus calamus]|uniref:Protein FAR1-RELATED SEQUENCE n=1 Tax=Acorus calamus TaxID=4465 RepID=A0AAV9CXA8_ACOCL|nr:Protein FAR1-RELATED SEQUENCE 3 [Acorus calamus]
MDTFFKAHFSARPTLQVFIAEFEKELIRRHELEAQAELDTTYTKPTLKTASPIEKQAAEIYTRAVFDRFQEEFMQSIGYRYDQIKSGVVSKYSVARHDGDEETFIVSFDASKKRANCSCNKFEFAGILCGHILTIFIIFDLRVLPEEYILNRWTRNAKSSTVVDERAQESTILRYNDILGDATKCAEKASMSVEVYKVAKEALQKAFAEIAAAEKNVSRGAQRDAININEESTIDDNLNDMSLYIPPHV